MYDGSEDTYEMEESTDKGVTRWMVRRPMTAYLPASCVGMKRQRKSYVGQVSSGILLSDHGGLGLL